MVLFLFQLFLSGCGFWVEGDDVFHVILEPVADGGLVFVVDVRINIHGDLDGAVPELFLDVLEVEPMGGLHAAGHVVAQHVERGLDAQLFADFGVSLPCPLSSSKPASSTART